MSGSTDSSGPASTWQRAAACYQESWGPVTGLFASDLLDAVGVAAGGRLLDVACGTGVVSERAAERGVSTVGADAASTMVLWARSRVAGVRFLAGDASRLPLRRARFAGAAINFGLHHFSDPAGGLREVARVLEPAGRLGYTAWAAPEENPALSVLNAIYGRLLGESSDRVEDGVFALGDRRRYRAELERAGYDGGTATLVAVTHDWRPRSAEAVFEAELRGGGRKTEMLARAGETRRRTIREAVCEAVREFETASGIAIPITAYVIAAEPRGRAR